MTNSSRVESSGTERIRETNISKDQRTINAKFQRHTELEFRNRRRSPDRLEGRHASRRLRSNFRFGIFGSIRNPFSRCRRTAFDEYGYSVHSLPLLASSSHPRSLRHPLRPILLLVLECDRDTRAKEEQTAARCRTKRRGRSGERPTSKWILIVLLVAPRDRRWLRRYSCYPWLKPLGRRVLRQAARERTLRGSSKKRDGKRRNEGQRERPGEEQSSGPFI